MAAFIMVCGATPAVFASNEHIDEFTCRTSAKAEHIQQKKAKVYQWRDEHGRLHFGDQPPSQAQAETKNYHAGKRYFELNLHYTMNLPPFYQRKLETRINSAYDTMQHWLPNQQLSQVTVNLWLFDNRNSYAAFLNKMAPSLSPNSQGFHRHKDNIAAALRRNDQQLLQTSVHEAVHVINAGLFGFIPRWLNEGLAEYMEHIDSQGQATLIPLNKYRMDQVRRNPLPVSYVFKSNQALWASAAGSQLYATSWALVAFMASDPKPNSLLRKILSNASATPCERVNVPKLIEQHYAGGVEQFENSFHQWLKYPDVRHSY